MFKMRCGIPNAYILDNSSIIGAQLFLVLFLDYGFRLLSIVVVEMGLQ
jgi:hypothetical protein